MRNYRTLCLCFYVWVCVYAYLSKEKHCSPLFFMCAFSYFLLCHCRLVCMCGCVRRGRFILVNVSLTDRFPGQPCCMLSDICCSSNPVGRVGKCAFFFSCSVCVLCVCDLAVNCSKGHWHSFPPLSSLPHLSPPHSSPLCVDAQKKRIVFQVTLSNHSP